MLYMISMNEALNKSIKFAGSSKALAEMLGVTAQAISQWHRVPAARVMEIERLTGVSRYDLRPDIFGPAPSASEAAA